MLNLVFYTPIQQTSISHRANMFRSESIRSLKKIINVNGIAMINNKKPNMVTTEPSYQPAYIPLMFTYGHKHLNQSVIPKFHIDVLISKIEELLQASNWKFVEDAKPLNYIDFEYSSKTHSCIVKKDNYLKAHKSANDFRATIIRTSIDYITSKKSI